MFLIDANRGSNLIATNKNPAGIPDVAHKWSRARHVGRSKVYHYEIHHGGWKHVHENVAGPKGRRFEGRAHHRGILLAKRTRYDWSEQPDRCQVCAGWIRSPWIDSIMHGGYDSKGPPKKAWLRR